MLDKLKLLMGLDDSLDELLMTLISLCKEEAYIYCNLPEYDSKLDYIVIQMVIERYNRLGSEGAESQSTDGVSTSYTNAAPEKELKEIVRAHVSQTTTYNDIQYGYVDQMILHCCTNIKLDTSTYARYIFADKYFKVMRQVKQGNEYFSVLLEVNE